MTIQELNKILKECGAVQDVEIQPQHRLKEDLLLTSFAMMLLIMRLEEKLERTIDPSEMIPVKTVNDLIEIFRKTNEGK